MPLIMTSKPRIPALAPIKQTTRIQLRLAGPSDRELGWRWGGDPAARPPDSQRNDAEVDEPAQHPEGWWPGRSDEAATVFFHNAVGGDSLTKVDTGALAGEQELHARSKRGSTVAVPVELERMGNGRDQGGRRNWSVWTKASPAASSGLRKRSVKVSR